MSGPALPQFNADRTLPKSVDVIIIGGGIIGASTALELAERGHSVLLCEKGQIAAEQSSRNWGWVRMSQRDPREMELMSHAFPLWENLEARTGHRTGFTRSGILFSARRKWREAELEKWAKIFDDFEFQSDFKSQFTGKMLRGAELETLMPGYGNSLRAGYYTPSDARAEPQWATHAIASGARAAGAVIVTNCAVRALDVSAGRVSGVFTEKGRVSASTVVVAGGAWSRLFLRNEGVFIPQLKLLNSVMRVTAVEGLPEHAVWARGFSMRHRSDGGLTLAGGYENITEIVPDVLRFGYRFIPAYLRQYGSIGFRLSNRWKVETSEAKPWGPQDRSPFEETRVLDPEPSSTALRRTLAAARDAFPVLKSADVTQSWGGLIDATPDEIPIISEVSKRPGLFVSTGYTGHGFGIGPAAGKLTADLITGDPPIVDPAAFALDRF